MRRFEQARRFDLHLHSTRSDGRFPPEDVLARCAAGRLDVVALTDHDLTTPLAPGLHTVNGRTLHVIAGAEVSGVHDGREFHLLVYFPAAVPDAFRTFCTERAQHRAERYARAVDRLGLPGLDAPDDAARRGERALTRHHLARALVDAGAAADTRDAFRRFVCHSHGIVDRVDLDFREAIRVARKHGGVTSWAHPPMPALRTYLPAFVGAGLHGIEALRPHTSARDRNTMRRLARQHDLVLTGGSDWHGWADADLGLFAVERGSLRGFLDLLEAA